MLKPTLSVCFPQLQKAVVRILSLRAQDIEHLATPNNEVKRSAPVLGRFSCYDR